MSYIENKQKLTEIIFADRNKEYGAYVLRSHYGETILKSIAMMASGTSLFFLGIFYLLRAATVSPEIISGQIPDTTITTVFKIPEPAKPVEADENPPAPKRPDTQTNSTNIVDSVSDSEPDTTSHETENTHPGTAVDSGTSAAGTGGSGKTTTFTVTGETNPVQTYAVDQLPEYEGGLASLYRFVRNNIEIPNELRDETINATVIIRFVVDENGRVTMPTALNKIESRLEAEALRVISMLPPFKSPGKVNGQPVKVYYQLPVKFVIR